MNKSCLFVFLLVSWRSIFCIFNLWLHLHFTKCISPLPLTCRKTWRKIKQFGWDLSQPLKGHVFYSLTHFFKSCSPRVIYLLNVYLHEVLLFNTSWRADSRFTPSQWETSLQSNAVSHWLGKRRISLAKTMLTVDKLLPKICLDGDVHITFTCFVYYDRAIITTAWQNKVEGN